jgi:Immunity protein 21
MRWISSAGGPLLLLDEGNIECWGGAIDITVAPDVKESSSSGGTRTDYDRACQIEDWLGRLVVGSGEALVLGGDPMATTWLGAEALDGGMLVRWLFAENEAEVLDNVRALPATAFQSQGLFSIGESKLLLFDSAFAGRNVRKYPTEYLAMQLKRGDYEVGTAVHESDDRMYVVVHRLHLRDR